MAGTFNPNFNPAQVMMGNKPPMPYPISGAPARPVSGPYMPTSPLKPPVKGVPARPVGNPDTPAGPVGPPSNIMGSEAVRATGTGPYDNAYRQDLATYAGGGFQKPGGFLGLNPTGPISGNPIGGGNAPIQGMPNDLLSMALGGQGFSFAPPQPKTMPKAVQTGNWQDWLQSLTGQFGGNFGGKP